MCSLYFFFAKDTENEVRVDIFGVDFNVTRLTGIDSLIAALKTSTKFHQY